MSTTRLEFANKVATITIDRPKQLNALNRETLLALSNHIDEIKNTNSSERVVRAVLIRGAGEKAFVAGADISELAEGNPEELSQLIDLGQLVMSKLEALEIIVIAAVDGFALGGGCELALACDLIVASSTAVFGLPETSLGIIPGFGGTQRLTARIGAGAARRLIYTGEKIDAETAYRLKLCEYLFDSTEFEQQLDKLLTKFVQSAPLAISAAKRAIANYDSKQLAVGLKSETELFCSLAESSDAKDGLRGFIEKTKITFNGK
ncbi:UNVERIFIED_CONTAM: hypothetical protein GTU68_027782 [Idotea baltica]|nr:hypothetical protein [Idotea baltica]